MSTEFTNDTISLDLHDWVARIIDGPTGFKVWEDREGVLHHVSREVSIALFVVRCLANVNCDGSEQVLNAIMRRRRSGQPTDKNAIPRTAANLEKYLVGEGITLTLKQSSELQRIIEAGMWSNAKHKAGAVTESGITPAVDKAIIKKANEVWPPEPKEKPAQPDDDVQVA